MNVRRRTFVLHRRLHGPTPAPAGRELAVSSRVLQVEHLSPEHRRQIRRVDSPLQRTLDRLLVLQVLADRFVSIQLVDLGVLTFDATAETIWPAENGS